MLVRAIVSVVVGILVAIAASFVPQLAGYAALIGFAIGVLVFFLAPLDGRRL